MVAARTIVLRKNLQEGRNTSKNMVYYFMCQILNDIDYGKYVLIFASKQLEAVC